MYNLFHLELWKIYVRSCGKTVIAQYVHEICVCKSIGIYVHVLCMFRSNRCFNTTNKISCINENA